MKNLLCHILICMAVFAGACVFPFSIAAQEINRPVLIITDVSGSMKDCAVPDPEWETGNTEDKNQKKYINKVNVLKHLLLSTVSELKGKPCKLGIYRMRYLAGETALYAPFLPIDSYETEEVIDKIKNDFITEYPVFNRRTPIADTLRQLDENELEALQGRMTILIISDGNETFYNLDEEWDREEPEEDDKVMGPLTEIRRLVKKYKDKLKLYTIYIETQCNENEDSTHDNFLMDIKTAEEAGEKDKHETGEFLLAGMASAAGGKGFFGNAMIDNEALVKELAEMLCYEEKIQVQIPPPVKPEPPAEIVAPVIAAVTPEPAPPEPVDSDRDGVYDDIDRCPGTPRGANVNEMGCWILKGINFDTAKWNIKPEFYPVLNEVAEVLRQNPGLRVEVQGHTDNRGTAVYNKRLSEKRAESVMKYFIRNGIEAERLSSVGYGLTIPIFPNDTPENRAGNRRVELKPLP